MSLARQLRTAGASWLNNCSRLLATQAQPTAGGLPEFFESADLSQGTCNIGLARRRDLTFRQDIRLTLQDGEKKTLKELLQVRSRSPEQLVLGQEGLVTPSKSLLVHRPGKPCPCLAAGVKQGQKAVVFGVPDCGKVCSEQMVPQYLAEVDNLRRAGVTKILCVAVGDAAAAKQWAAGLKVDPSKVGEPCPYAELGTADVLQPASAMQCSNSLHPPGRVESPQLFLTASQAWRSLLRPSTAIHAVKDTDLAVHAAGGSGRRHQRRLDAVPGDGVGAAQPAGGAVAALCRGCG